MNFLPESLRNTLNQAVKTNIVACLRTEIVIQNILDKSAICQMNRHLFRWKIESDIQEFTVNIDKSILRDQFWWIYWFTSEEDLLDELYINKKESSSLFDEAVWILYMLQDWGRKDWIELYDGYISTIRRIYEYRYLDREIKKQLDSPSFPWE